MQSPPHAETHAGSKALSVSFATEAFCPQVAPSELREPARTRMIHSIPSLARFLGAFGLAALLLLGVQSAQAGQNQTAHPGTPARTLVKATASAYGAGAACNAQWSGRTAIGTRLRTGDVTSAAADWSKFPLGTRFRVVETGRVYQVDDYGSAMVGKVKVDLFTPNGAQMRRWGVRNVTLEILEWGSRERSLALLSSRSASRYAHIRRMVASLRSQLAETKVAGVRQDSKL